MSDIANSAGVSRQALYLHFANRTELLIETTHYIDRVKDVDRRLARSRHASSGLERLEAYVDAWGNYIPEIYGVANALIVMGVTDDGARLAWEGRLAAVREGCEVIVTTLFREGQLSQRLSPPEATDALCAHLSVETWWYLRDRRGWSQTRYVEAMQQTLKAMLLA
jgi:AcrR family transcriptional regulator